MMPLAGRRILVTRATEQSTDLVKMLSSAGAAVECFSAIEIAAPSSWDSLDRLIHHSQDFQWLVFSSSNGVRFLLRRLDALHKSVKDLTGPRIAAVGAATAEALRSAGLPPHVTPLKFRAEEMLHLFPEVMTNTRVAVVRALEGREELISDLSRRGASVHLAVAYQTLIAATLPPSLEESLAAGRFDAVTFTSPSTVQGVLGNLRAPAAQSLPPSTSLISIGPVTTAAIAAFGLPAVEAAESTSRGLVEALIRHLAPSGGEARRSGEAGGKVKLPG